MNGRIESRSTAPRVRIMLAVTCTALVSGLQAEEEKRAPALNGYCPASYLLIGKAVQGDPSYQSTYAGELYHFANAEAKKTFDADPEKYLPQFGGLCLTALGGPYGNRFPSDPEIFEIVDGKVYLFSSERARRAYHDMGRNRYIPNARDRFNEPQLRGHCPVSYQLAGKAVKGQENYKVVYRTRVYHLAGADAKEAFLKDPEKYEPQYRGYCAIGTARNKRFPTDGSVFSVVDGKTYLLWDDEAKKEFDAHPAEVIKKADANWVTLKDEK